MIKNEEITEQAQTPLYRGDLQTGPLKKSQPAGDPFHFGRSTSFWHTGLGRTLKGQTITGKAIYSTLGVGLSLLTGINLQPITNQISQPAMTDFFTDINFWSLFAFFVAALIGYLKTKTGATVDRLLDKADLGAQMYARFKSKDSDEGEKLSENERDQLIHLLGTIFEAQQQKGRQS